MSSTPRITLTLPLSVFVPGLPVAQPRPRAFRRGDHAGVYNPSKSDGWKARIAASVLEAVPGQVPIAGEALIDWPVSLDLAFFFPRPASHFQTGRNAGTLKGSAPIWHASKPDRDNLDKAVLDALVHWHILADDSLVCHGHIIKRYLAPGMTTTPGCLIRIAHPPEVPR